MSRGKKQRSFAEAWAELQAQRATGKPEPKQHPPYIAVSRVKLWPEVFQHRRPPEHVSAAHVRELQRAAAQGDLEPIEVWWDGKAWACIDGHHRLRAYKAAGKGSDDVPVKVFQGSPQEATARAAQGNTRDKLPMGRAEKLRAAWRLVVSTAMSKAAIVKASGVSDGLVASMRRVKAQLETRESAPMDFEWEAARATAAGKAQEEIDWDDKTQKDAEKMAAALGKTFGTLRHNQLEAFALALEAYDSRLPDELRRLWGDAEDGADEDDED